LPVRTQAHRHQGGAGPPSGSAVTAAEHEDLMFKYIGIILALMPFIVFARAIFMRSMKRSQAVTEFKKQLDLAVTLILVFIGCAVAYSLAKLIFQF
jgi:Na+/H+-dicarboxylate symporter